MKQVAGYWLPDTEKHFPNALIDGEYQAGIRNHALAEMKRLGFTFQTAVDIGANVGLWAVPLSSHFETVVCFEPVPESAECLRKNTEGRNVIVHQLALSDRSGTDNINILEPFKASGAASFLPVTKGGKPLASRSISVEVRTLDGFRLSNVDLIKIDVQGWESHVLKGAVETLERCRPMLVYEDAEGLQEMIASLGYVNVASANKDFIAVKVRR
jgi:FkbM family methyltransferase